ncbi:polysaccharide pyruvyl transferase CsaB [Anaerobacillus alkaliphilus]|uniref:Polysaccharide pyruvyl transferase CsaB n=1 Tax=Anaerobacillus alkaliphilus TaxID=1548597 RepID=A0A4V1LGS2_9BACI|nr:polysaccharide pyruvyl transferase CsaB [Anaerobacillus alkaliphilus]RXJ02959.1 polysaccharide pyruvyl transferase CsaB [Anaerobacillus alkaliphilus]
MKVVLSGYYGFHNVGDEAILFSIIQALKKANQHVQITVLSNDPDYTKNTYEVDAVNRWKLKEVSAAIKQADGLISGGGSLLQDKTGNRSVIYYSAIMLIAKFHRKPFVVYAQGIGPVDKEYNQKITKFTLSKAALISVRDEASKKFLQQIGIKNEIIEVPDPVLGIESQDGYANEWLEKTGLTEKKYISVSVRDWPSEIKYLEMIAKALNGVSEHQIVFVPMHGEHDEKTSFKVAEMMDKKSYIAPYEFSIADKIAVIGGSQLLVGMRLHALIFAAVMDTPFTALSYDPKIDAFAKLAKQPVAAHVNEANWTEETVLEVIKQQLNNLPKYTDNVKKYADQAKLESQNTAILALQSFKK